MSTHGYHITPIQQAARKRDEAIEAAKAEYWTEQRKLAARMQAKIDAAEREYLTASLKGLREPVRRAA